MPAKTPLVGFNVRSSARFTQTDAMDQVQRATGRRVGMVVNLCNTTRYYAPEVFQVSRVRFQHLPTRGGGQVPSRRQLRRFAAVCDDFTREHPEELILVHCTHGLNRTGYFIAAYMCMSMGSSVETAVQAFSDARPPGIQRENLLAALHARTTLSVTQ